MNWKLWTGELIMRFKWLFFMATFLFIFLPFKHTNALTEDIFAQQTVANQTNPFFVSMARGQSFTNGTSTKQLSAISLKMANCASSPFGLLAQVQTSIIIGQGVLFRGNIYTTCTAGSWSKFDFTQAITILPSVKYYIFFWGIDSNSNYSWTTNYNAFSGGGYVVDGSGELPIDMTFKLYYEFEERTPAQIALNSIGTPIVISSTNIAKYTITNFYAWILVISIFGYFITVIYKFLKKKISRDKRRKTIDFKRWKLNK